MQKRLLQWLAALLLVFGQTALLAHQTDIDAHHDKGDDCAVCQVAHSLDVTAAAPQPLTVLALPADEHLFSSYTAPLSTTLYRARSRAPPVPHA